jgi:hypothetical protein
MRTVDPYRDLDVIDAHGPRTNQAVVGSLSLVALLAGLEWIVALLALQLAVGLTFGRRYCLPCLLWFEVLQPRLGEGPIEDAAPPRFANMVGLGFLGAATLAFLAGAPTAGWVLTGIVAALALLAAITGFCAGCEMYRLIARVRGVRSGRLERIDPADAGGARTVLFKTRYCRSCAAWERALGERARAIAVDERPELARRYGIASTPVVVALAEDGRVLARYEGDPTPEALAALR